MKCRKYALFVLIATGCFVSCSRRALEVLASGMRIEHIPDYSLQYPSPVYIPEHFRVNMYDSRSGELVYKDFIRGNGGVIKSVPGEYFCFLCNFDEASLSLTGEGNVSTLYLTGPPAGESVDSSFAACRQKLRSSITEGAVSDALRNDLQTASNRVMSLTECFWAGGTYTIVPVLAETDGPYTVRVNTSSVLKQGYVSLDNITGTEYIARIDCYVTNLSAGMNPATRVPDTLGVTQMFSILCEDGKAGGSFFYFGANCGKNAPHILYALVTDVGGGKHLYVYDLGPMDEVEGLLFKIDSGITVKEPVPGTGGGLQPALGEWGVEYVDILLAPES